jgi:hypothetical protein
VNFGNAHTRREFMVNLGSWSWSTSHGAPSWDLLKKAAIWTRPSEDVQFLSLPLVPAQQIASEEGIGIMEVELVEGMVQSVTVYDASQPGVPSGVANMAVRAGILMAEPGRHHPHLQSLLAEHVPMFLWGLQDDVARILDSNEAHIAGSRVVHLYLFLRPRMAGPGHGHRFRELSVTVVGAEGSLQPQVSFHPCLVRPFRVSFPFIYPLQRVNL